MQIINHFASHILRKKSLQNESNLPVFNEQQYILHARSVKEIPA